MSALMALLLVAGCASARDDAAPPPAPSDPAVVQTAAGAVRGTVAEDHRLFAGIPYAAPPVGPLRWKDPEPAPAWQGERDATAFGPRCMQDLNGDIELGRQTDEDCLSLNVWTPAGESDKPRPVMVWIHGGSFVAGSGGIYDSRRLVSRGDIVVVTVNYRLGTLGFLAHPALGAPGAVGNYGLADQQAALRWVRDNIGAFGGDPARVTIAGESAGAMSVCDHLVAPGSQGLFDAAIMMSSLCQAQVGLPVAQQRSLDYAAQVGCPDPATAGECLRALPANRLRTPIWYYDIGEDQLSGPVTGTAALPTDPVAAFAEARAARVPVLMGTTRDEWTLFVALQKLRGAGDYTAGNYPRLLAQTYGADAAAVEGRYPLTGYPDVALAYAATVTDGVLACPAQRWAGDLSRDEDVYFYEFNDRDAPAPEPLRTLPFPVGASHSLELRYLFDVGGAPPPDEAQFALGDRMIDYWASFVKTGEPGGDWKNLSGGVLSLQPDGDRMVDEFGREHHCDFWDGLR
ncbi:carboxylesterase family protein [Mycobacterium sp. 236(2023)]|uniref:carboxylesterase/lipase family protein n=1 Tax=Mycobacterium sp. 236(2023) TaxID=3038163 RepID=UPI00241594DA|nr:carboxylesterase family protein [Mycobacterium sp. 236(2023)]MDG4663937.1 carboxylesterase family protein [Mycobacterium sp. 236(2023)]